MGALRFLHIPKTGGSTLTSILLRQYRGAAVFSFEGGRASYMRRYAALSAGERRNLALFVGHAPLVTGIEEADNADTITLLRDPVSRVKSFCRHVAEGKTPHLRQWCSPGQFDLDGFLASGNPELSNLQTKILINEGRLASSERLDKMSPADARDAALESLFERLLSYGLQECFEESVELFASLLGWAVPDYPLLNKSSPDSGVVFERRHIDRIMELNSIDSEVYEVARRRFPGRPGVGRGIGSTRAGRHG